jgi:hypothetical protein
MNIPRASLGIALLISVCGRVNAEPPIGMAEMLDESTLAVEVVRDWHVVDGPV